MKLMIEINLDNDAYGDLLGWELGENLQHVIESIGLGYKRGFINDTNGNTTGKWSITND